MSVDDPNSSVRNFLDVYTVSKTPQNYAVLIKGAWGAGKTHFIKAYFAAREVGFIYVSLYGITSTADIDAQIIRQLHPILSSKAVKLGGVIAKAVLKGTLKIDLNADGRDDGAVSSSLPDLTLSDFATKAKGRVLIFDDLERAPMPTPTILGYINALVEHEDARAIIVAHDDEIPQEEEEGFDKVKEKLIGQTLSIRPSIRDAFPVIASAVSNEWARDFILKRQAHVVEVFARSSTDNLRALKYAMWDFRAYIHSLPRQ